MQDVTLQFLFQSWSKSKDHSDTNISFLKYIFSTNPRERKTPFWPTYNFLMVSGGIAFNKFAEICLILKAKFGNDLFVLHVK